MGNIVTKNQPCLDPDCGSSDARQVYEDGGSTCFSCGQSFPAEGAPKKFIKAKIAEEDEHIKSVNQQKLDEILALKSRGFKERGITLPVCEFFGVKVSYNSDGVIDTHYYPYVDGDNLSYKVRRMPKQFSSVGEFRGLFGKNMFSGGGKRLVITEGEIDALSVAKAYLDKYDKIYPVVSMGATTNVQQLLNNRDWLRSFSEVILCFDNDKPGQEATSKALKIIGIDKVKIALLPEKDPNEILLKHGGEKILQCIWDAAPWKPSGIIGKEALWEALAAYNEAESIPYPACLAGVNKKLKGKRLGEIVLFISGTGSGKSTILREDIINTLESTPDNVKVGIMSLEEAPAETARKLAGMAIDRNPSNGEVSLEDLKIGFDKVFGKDRVVLLDHQGSIDDGSIIDQLEYMCLMGCQYLYIDHITILVSEGADGLTGNEAIDKVMNDFLRLTKRHPVWIGLVSHLRKSQSGGKSFEEGKLPSIDDIKGSGSIKQISFDIIAFARNMTAANPIERNTIKMSVLKARTTGLTGPVEGAYYNIITGRLGGVESVPEEDDFKIIN